MSILRLVYASQPFGFDLPTLFQILREARSNNARCGITGALICRGDLYLQLLEGPEAAVRETYARIVRDDRHLEVRCLIEETASTRLFPDWAMLDDPARSWMWTQEEVSSGALDRATSAEILAVFERVRSEVTAPA